MKLSYHSFPANSRITFPLSPREQRPNTFPPPPFISQGAAPNGRAPPVPSSSIRRTGESPAGGRILPEDRKTTPALGARPLGAYVPLRCFPSESGSEGSICPPADASFPLTPADRRTARTLSPPPYIPDFRHIVPRSLPRLPDRIHDFCGPFSL